MATTNHKLSQMSSAALRELMIDEKENVRLWLRTEMNSLMEPLIESLFDKLITKLTSALIQNESNGGEDSVQVAKNTRHEAPNVPVTTQNNVQVHHHRPQFHYNSRSLITEFWNNSQLSEASGDLPNRDDDNNQSSEQPVNDNIGDDTAPENSNCISVKLEEFDEPNNELITTNQAHGTPSLSSSTTLNEQSNQNSDVVVKDEDDCYEREIELESTDFQVPQQGNCQPSTSTEISLATNNVLNPQIADYDLDERPAKRPRLEATQVSRLPITGLSSSIESGTQTEEDPQIKAFKPEQVVTIRMKCLSTCTDTFDTKVKLDSHMWNRHFTRPFRCLFKKCHNSFCNEYSGLLQHLQQCHPNVTKWKCGKCRQKFPSHVELSCHDILYHQLGRFKCSFPGCKFTRKCRGKVLEHYRQHQLEQNHLDVLTESNTSNEQFDRSSTNHNQQDIQDSCVEDEQSNIIPQNDIVMSDSLQDAPLETSSSSGEVKDQTTKEQSDKHILTVAFQCQSTCSLMFETKAQLQTHMQNEHGIGGFPCLVKNCGQSFTVRTLLGQHIKDSHSKLTVWYCGRCSKHFKTFELLSGHNRRYHVFGQFKCTFDGCQFMGKYSEEVHKHYARQHMPILTCQHPGCGQRIKKASHLEIHNYGHTGTHLYKCKWPNCGYVNRTSGTTLKHIKTRHLSSETDSNVKRNPKDFLERPVKIR